MAERPWWPATSAAASEALHRLWRHAVAVGLAAWRLAREANDPEPERVADAGLLHGLGRWAAAAIDPAWLAAWLAEADPRRRREFECRTLGVETTALGRTLAERWGCDPLVAEAAWLHADRDGGLNGCAAEPARLALIQQAYAQAERTPWALSSGEGREPSGADPRIRLLTAEVQVRCGSAFVEPDATPHEERLSRADARLRLESAELRTASAARDRFLGALAGSEPTEDPETWAERAGLAWCGDAGRGHGAGRLDRTGSHLLSSTTSAPGDRPADAGRARSRTEVGRVPRSTSGPIPITPRPPPRRWPPGTPGKPGPRWSPSGPGPRRGSTRSSALIATASSARNRGPRRPSSTPWPSSPPGPATS